MSEMIDVTENFLNSEAEYLAESDKVIKELGLTAEEEKRFLEEFSNGRGDEQEEKEESTKMLRAAGAYTDSSLVKYTCLSPNCNSPRNHAIDTITIHEVWGECSMAALGAIFKPSSRQASSNYGCCTDGVALFVHERDRAWTSGSAANDNRAVTIEVSNSRTYPNAVSDSVYNRLIDLCTDICKRNGKTKMVWCGTLAKTNARTFASNEMRMTLHTWFQATDCPGYWLESHMQDIADKVNAKLKPISYPKVPFSVKVVIDDLYIRKGAGTTYKTNGYAAKSNYVIEEVKNDFGKLATGAGWIYLGNSAYVTIGQHIEEEKDMSPFKDMATTDSHYAQVKALYDAGIWKTNSKGQIKPKKTVTRAELAVWLCRLMKKAKLL